jgi:hypothetical protein
MTNQENVATMNKQTSSMPISLAPNVTFEMTGGSMVVEGEWSQKLLLMYGVDMQKC